MGGWFKPVMLAIAALPIIFIGAYDSDLTFPLFGDVQIPILYLGLIIFMIPITGNTINSIDVLNGVASGFMVIASFTLSICLFILQNYEIAVISLPLGFVSLAFYKYHKIPSKIFPGDSGALAFGAMYGAIAIVGGVEIIAAIILLPAIINSFLFLSSVKRIVEHRQIKGKPVEHTDDFKLKATKDQTAPVTLVRLILTNGPLSEKQVGLEIFKLAIFSGILGIITAFLMGHFRLKYTLYGFLFAMWILIIIGGAIVILVLGPISISQYGEFNSFFGSVIQGTIAIILVVIWILILSALKNWIFKKELKF